MSKFYLRQNKRKKKSFFLLQAPIHHSFIGVFQKKKASERVREVEDILFDPPPPPPSLGIFRFLTLPQEFPDKKVYP